MFSRLKPTDKFAAIGLLVATIALVIGIYDPRWGDRIDYGATAWLSRAKQINIAVGIYAADHDNHLPLLDPNSTAGPFLDPYLPKQPAQLKPEFLLTRMSKSYVWNASLSGMAIARIHSPEKTWLFHSAKPVSTGRLLVGFADGHVKYMNEDAFHQIESVR